MQWIPRQTPLYIGKSEGCRAIHYFLISAIKLWVLVQTASARRLLRRFERHGIFDRIHHMWKIRPNFSHLYSPKISNVKYPTGIYQTWVIRSNTPQMWTIRPNSSQLWHIRQNSSHVKNPTKFLTPIFADNVSCKIFDRLYQTWEIQWYTAHMWQNSIEVIQDVTYWTEYITCEKSDRISHTYIRRKYHM